MIVNQQNTGRGGRFHCTEPLMNGFTGGEIAKVILNWHPLGWKTQMTGLDLLP
jgi:hypothetical protein